MIICFIGMFISPLFLVISTTVLASSADNRERYEKAVTELKALKAVLTALEAREQAPKIEVCSNCKQEKFKGILGQIS
jgi:hypothetical protein